MLEFSEARHFDIWMYGIGHSTLVLKSLREKNRSSNERIHILLTSVARISLPTHFLVDSISQDSSLIKKINSDLYPTHKNNNGLVFFHNGKMVGFVIAGGIVYAIDNGSMRKRTENETLNILLSLNE